MPFTGDIVEPQRSWRSALMRGLRCRCPACGEGRLFASYTRVVARCEACGEDLSHQRADDAPPYIVIMIVGHVVVGAAFYVERAFRPELWVHMAAWIPATLALSLTLLPPIKGAVVGIQWANRMHGFGGEHS